MDDRPINRHSFLGRAILNAYAGLGVAKYHYGDECTESCERDKAAIEMAENQLETIIRTLLTE